MERGRERDREREREKRKTDQKQIVQKKNDERTVL